MEEEKTSLYSNIIQTQINPSQPNQPKPNLRGLPPKSPKDQAEPSQNTKTKSWFWKPNLPYYTLTVGPG